MKERKKKKTIVKMKEKKHLPLEDHVLTWLKQDFLKQALPWLEASSLTQQFLKSNVVLTWIRGKKRATQLLFFLFLFLFFRKGLHGTVNNFFF